MMNNIESLHKCAQQKSDVELLSVFCEGGEMDVDPETHHFSFNDD